MPQQNDNDSPTGPRGSETVAGTEIEALLQQGQDRLKQVMSSGGPRGGIVLVLLVLAAFLAWTAYYTVPSDSVAVVQRFGKYLKEVPPGLHFKLPLGIDVATIVPVKRQLKQEFGFTTPGANDPYQSFSRWTAGDQARNGDGHWRPERRIGGMGGSIPHFGPG